MHRGPNWPHRIWDHDNFAELLECGIDRQGHDHVDHLLRHVPRWYDPDSCWDVGGVSWKYLWRMRFHELRWILDGIRLVRDLDGDHGAGTAVEGRQGSLADCVGYLHAAELDWDVERESSGSVCLRLFDGAVLFACSRSEQRGHSCAGWVCRDCVRVQRVVSGLGGGDERAGWARVVLHRTCEEQGVLRRQRRGTGVEVGCHRKL
mmetsp:Transcript_47358/g.116042  ORF Transcript_47358/g.116042 Transcript_47358/m.116042 type:complete len:205 (+) Transcript_47358:125-739(+)